MWLVPNILSDFTFLWFCCVLIHVGLVGLQISYNVSLKTCLFSVLITSKMYMLLQCNEGDPLS